MGVASKTSWTSNQALRLDQRLDATTLSFSPKSDKSHDGVPDHLGTFCDLHARVVVCAFAHFLHPFRRASMAGGSLFADRSDWLAAPNVQVTHTEPPASAVLASRMQTGSRDGWAALTTQAHRSSAFVSFAHHKACAFSQLHRLGSSFFMVHAQLFPSTHLNHHMCKSHIHALLGDPLPQRSISP